MLASITKDPKNGENNYLGTTLRSFSEPFGMESFIGKKAEGERGVARNHECAVDA
jgi:hypothetical protein